jgi:undecaprenyl-diphosphatase
VALGASAASPALARAEDNPGAPRLLEGQHFTVDPVVDGVLVTGGLVFSELLGMVLNTGEIKPSAPGSKDNLLAIDRVAVTQNIDPNAARKSDYGLWVAYGYAAVDTALTGWKGGRYGFLVDGVMYLESYALTSVFTDMTKIGVRRPRPRDYLECGSPSPTGSCSSTDLELSFFSGHASVTGALTGTATYLAFARHGHTWRPWITLAAGTALTAFVSYERVRSGAHFPTDVIMGSMAGAGIGILVPHFHRRPHYHDKELEAPPVWIGIAPSPDGENRMVALGGHF